MKRISAFVLALLLASAALASCGSQADNSPDVPAAVNGGDPGEEAAGETTEDPYVHDSLPDGLDLGGATVTFLYRDEVHNEFCADSLDGEIVNDALYNSHLTTSQRLNADIEVILEAGHYVDARQGYMDRITNSVLAGDDVYDWVDLMIGNASLMQQKNIFRNVADNAFIDLDGPWYLQDMVKNVGLNGKLYFVSGDASLGYLKCTFCYFFNMQMAQDYGLGDLYDIVNAGGWTIDKVMEFSELTASDLNGDGVFNEDDRLGFISHDYNHPKGYLTSLGADMYTLDADGERHFSFGSDRDALVCDKLYQLFHETSGFYAFNGTNAVTKDQDGYNKLSSKFKAGEILGISAEMDDAVSQFRDMEQPYGILPYPKLNEAQPDYISTARNTHNSFSLTLTASDADAACAVMEALACSNYNTALPAYFETALKVKHSVDNETAQCFDLVKNSTKLYFWYVYANAIGAPDAKFLSFSVNASGAGQMASSLAKVQSALERSLADYLAAAEELVG